jgi:hypothetical protein
MTIPTSMITPGTLYVTQTGISTLEMANISRLAISDPAQSTYFQVSRPIDGPDSPNNSSLYFLGPRTIVIRLMTAAAATGTMLTLTAPAIDSTYQVQFYGPYVQCQTASDTVSGIIDKFSPATDEVYSGYFAYVPDLSSPAQWGSPSDRGSNPMNGSNQLWLSYKQNGTGWVATPFPKCPNTEYLVCQLYNTSYDLTVAFQNGGMTVSYDNFTDLVPVEYPIEDRNKPSDPVQMSYSAYMWAFTDLLTGSMGLYKDDSTWFADIQTNIENTALLGSSDLDCFFAVDWMFSNKTWEPPTPQRQLDIDFARNRSLGVLIPELSVNLTVSLMNDILLA